MANIRILGDGRLLLPDGVELDLEPVWLSEAVARIVADEADIVVHSSVSHSADISAEQARIDELLRGVNRRTGEVGARRYRGAGLVALVLTEFC